MVVAKETFYILYFVVAILFIFYCGLDVFEESEADLVSERSPRSIKSKSPDSFSSKPPKSDRKISSGYFINFQRLYMFKTFNKAIFHFIIM